MWFLSLRKAPEHFNHRILLQACVLLVGISKSLSKTMRRINSFSPTVKTTLDLEFNNQTSLCLLVCCWILTMAFAPAFLFYFFSIIILCYSFCNYDFCKFCCYLLLFSAFSGSGQTKDSPITDRLSFSLSCLVGREACDQDIRLTSLFLDLERLNLAIKLAGSPPKASKKLEK